MTFEWPSWVDPLPFPFPELHNFDRLYSRWQLYWCHNIRAWWGKTVCAGGPAPAPPGRTWPAPAVSCHWGWWSITSTVQTPSSGVTRTPPAGPRKPHSGRRGNFANIRYNLSSVQRWHSWRACRQFFETKPLSGNESNQFGFIHFCVTLVI